ncbi:MAG: discoidin domain-containing protein [Paramuribaculum sp.]|nr:discoidin domain-containing protein [Paramuribaculum sp.]
MKKNLLSIAVLSIASLAHGATTPPLKGFYYGNDTAPKGHEWQSPDSLSYNKEQPRATFWTFESLDAARQVLPDNSKYHISLNGNWKFSWVPTPEKRPIDFYQRNFDDSSWDEIRVPSNWNIAGLQTDGTKKYGTPIYVNQPVIFWHQVKVDDWKGGVMRTPPENWTTYTDRNEVGSYRRTFTIPTDWNGREVYVNFDGVDSFFYLWINGNYVGFSKNSRNAARFNITKFLVKGENTIAVEVYRNSDGSFLEAQDMFRLPGIFRSVSLYSTSPLQIRDLTVIPDLSSDYKDGQLVMTSSIRNLSGKDVKNLRVKYTLFANKLYSDENEPVAGGEISSEEISLAKATEKDIVTVLNVNDPNKWSAEQPWRYTLVAQLTDKKGNVLETVSTYVGFRKVELRDTPAEEDEFGLAGRYFYVNGQPVKLKGVNRHETNPSVGHAIDRDWMTQEVMMMKRANINHVRNSHYPDDPYWYYLADKYGIYLEDEANLESHEYYYGQASLSHVPEWENAHIARNMELVHSRVNSPSVVIWSLGNEAGPGKNFVTAYNAIKAFDSSRPVQYERNNDIVDIGSNQYPSIAWVQEAVKGKMKIKYPFHISEYAHSMGNAVGNLVDYWDAIESTNHFMGGAIWDWIDQSLYYYDPETGDKYLAFGGDFGDTPTDGQFVMNGIVFGDMSPKPQYWEVKKVYQNVGVTPIDIMKGQIEIFNKNYFTPLTDYHIVWTLYEDGKLVQNGLGLQGPRKAVDPREKMQFTIPFDTTKFKNDSEYFVNLEFKLAKNMPWAEAGYVQMSEQLPVKSAEGLHCLACSSKGEKVKVEKGDGFETVSGEGFTAKFDLSTGTLYSLIYGDKNVIVPGHGPTLDAFRAYLNNDTWVYGQWFANGLYNLKHKVLSFDSYTDKKGNPVLSFTIESQAPQGGKMTGGNGNSKGIYGIDESQSTPFGPDDFKFTTNQTWTIFPDGSIELNAIITSNNPSLILPRLGYTMEVPDNFGTFTYYGRGPEENYNDRKTGQFVGRYSNSVANMLTEYTRPQSNGNREEVRWAALTDGNEGVLFVAPETMSATAIPYTEMELFEANHPYKLPVSTSTTLHLDLGVTGLGGASCGQGGPLEPDRVKAESHRFTFIIRPSSESELDQKAKVKGAGDKPMGISRDRQGYVTIDYPGTEEIIYSIDGSKKSQTYKAPFEFKKGGSIKAWLKSNPAISTIVTFPKIETIHTEAIYSSSQEPDYGEGSNLTDGDPSTIWHTMYSVTVAPYPHWVDFDAGETKTIKGVSYLPRQDGNSTGNVKAYEIYVSNDKDNWGEPVAKGEFSRGDKLKTVMFSKPVKGRYIRFKALSAQDGRDYASGAEFEVIAE